MKSSEFTDVQINNVIAETKQLLLSVACPKINLCVRIDNGKVVELYRQLGYAIEPVHLIGKRLIKDG